MGTNGDGGTTSRRILELLGDTVARQILQAGSQNVVTIADLTDQTNVSQSTVYRRLSDLVDCGLMREEHSVTSTPSKRAYVTTVEHIGVDIGEAEITAQLNPAPRYEKAVRELNLEPLTVDLDTRTVTVRLSLDDDELFEQFTHLWESRKNHR